MPSCPGSSGDCDIGARGVPQQLQGQCSVLSMANPWQVGSNTVRKLEVNEAERDVQSRKSNLEDLLNVEDS